MNKSINFKRNGFSGNSGSITLNDYGIDINFSTNHKIVSLKEAEKVAEIIHDKLEEYYDKN